MTVGLVWTKLILKWAQRGEETESRAGDRRAGLQQRLVGPARPRGRHLDAGRVARSRRRRAPRRLVHHPHAHQARAEGLVPAFAERLPRPRPGRRRRPAGADPRRRRRDRHHARTPAPTSWPRTNSSPPATASKSAWSKATSPIFRASPKAVSTSSSTPPRTSSLPTSTRSGANVSAC